MPACNSAPDDFRIKTVLLSAYDRKRLLAATGKLEKLYRQEAIKLVDDLLQGWREFAKR